MRDRLNSLAPEIWWPSHGSYKPSQLLVRGEHTLLVDFDQFCLADPALDVGYFLAYLRPPGLFYHRAGCREWFEAASDTFTSAYVEKLRESGIASATGADIIERAHVYEAGLLLKIAARRANRLHSPRPAEVSATLAEISTCLATAAPQRG